MTAMNLWAKGRIGMILTDSAVYSQDGTIFGFKEKTYPIEPLKMAVVARGHIWASAWLGEAIAKEFASFEEFLGRARPFLMEFHSGHADIFELEAGSPEVDIGVVGWAARRKRAEAYALSSVDYSHGGGAPSFALRKHDAFIFPAPVDELTRAGIVRNGSIVGEGEALLRRVIRVQRRTPVDFFGAHAHIIGGAQVLTTITEHNITRRVLDEWPDRAGEKIAIDEAA